MGLQPQISPSPRSLRRLLLTSTLLLLFAWAAPENVRAGTSQIDAELGHYGGTSSGTFQSAGCASAPAARVYYEGLGGRVAVRPAQVEAARDTAGPRAPQGSVFGLAGVVQHERFALLRTGETPAVDNLPTPTMRGAISVRAGYDWKMLGLTGGMIIFQRFERIDVEGCSPEATACPQYRGAALAAFPDLVVRLGPWQPLHVEVGLGAYNVPTLLQPGLYCGLGAERSGWQLNLRLGNHNTFHRSYSTRIDVGLGIPMSRTLRLKSGVALSEGEEGAPRAWPFVTNEWEGRVGLELIFPGR